MILSYNLTDIIVPAEEENEADLSDSEQFGKASEVAGELLISDCSSCHH